VIRILRGHLAGSPYMVGKSFSAVDVYVGAQIGWGMHFGSIPKEPEFVAYADRILNRPAAIRARAIDDALAARP
jgi:glutathione S-transferase